MEPDVLDEEPQPALLEATQRHFVEIEKNIISLGFFTPSSSRIMTDARKTTTMVRYQDGKKIETTVSILPSAYYGLPVTADQDKYFAFLKIVQDTRRKTGVVPNPVGFTSAELLRLLGRKKNGKNYDEISEWMKRMTATSINAAVYFAGGKVWVEDTFHVFERAAMKGMELGDGRIADTNYVWLSRWQYENIAMNFQMPIDFEAYKQLRNHIAKALAPLLQIWLYSSLGSGRFEKSYNDLCQLLAIRRYNHLSKIKDVLGPSLDELVKVGHIASWTMQPRASGEDFKLLVTHGPKFFQDRGLHTGRKAPEQLDSDTLVRELVNRGVEEGAARQLLAQVPETQPVLEQLEWGDYLIHTAPAGKFRNPAGFYIHLIRNAVTPSFPFETSSQRNLRRQTEAQEESEAASRLADEMEYAEYRREQLEDSIRSRYPLEQLDAALSRVKQEIRKETPESRNWLPVRLEELAMQRLKTEAANETTILSFEEFLARRDNQLSLFDSSPENH